MKTANEIRNLILSDAYVYLHYTDEEGLKSIINEQMIRPDSKNAVYFTRELFNPKDANLILFIGASTHTGRGSHLLVVRLDCGIRLERMSAYEYRASQSIRLRQHEVMTYGPTPS